MRTKPIVTYGAAAAVILVAATLGAALRLVIGSDEREGHPHNARRGSGDMMTAAQAALPPGTATESDVLHPAAVKVSSPGFWSWALLDRGTSALKGSANMATTQRTASMIKAWLAADYLRLAASKGQKPSTAALSQLSIMIRDSDNNAASATYVTLGSSATIKRLISICGLTDTKAGADWAHTMMSARDAVRMGLCIADGRGAGATWTEWVLTEMRAVRGVGRFGPVEVLPAAEVPTTAMKNGWVNLSDGTWHVNCMASGSSWVLAVQTVYPQSLGLAHGSGICRSVTKQLMGQPT